MSGGRFGAPALGVAAGCGALAGVILALALNGGGAREVATFTRTVSPRTTSTGIRLISTASVPEVVGSRLDRARATLGAAGFGAVIEGSAPPAAPDEPRWVVSAENPKGGRSKPVGTVVRLRIVRG